MIAFYIFNDGVQTVIGIAGAYGADVLGVQLIFNMITILIVQFVAAPGAVFFGWLADKIGTKESLIIALMGWIFVVFFVLVEVFLAGILVSYIRYKANNKFQLFFINRKYMKNKKKFFWWQHIRCRFVVFLLFFLLFFVVFFVVFVIGRY